MTTSAKYALTYLAAGQASPEVTINAAIEVLEAMSNLAVEDDDATAPPGSPVIGACYIPAATASGAWVGWEKSVALWTQNQAWLRVIPKEGQRAWIKDEDVFKTFDGTNWV